MTDGGSVGWDLTSGNRVLAGWAKWMRPCPSCCDVLRAVGRADLNGLNVRVFLRYLRNYRKEHGRLYMHDGF